MKRISIVVPFFNEERRVGDSIRLIKKFLKVNSDIDVLYVDDGSSDNCREMLELEISKEEFQRFLKEADNSVSVIGYKKNLGKGGAVKFGMMQASGDYCLYTDFDFSIALEKIPVFVKRLEGQGKSGLVIASRFEEGTVHKKQSLLRRFMGRAFNYIMKFILTLPVKDTQCGFKLLDQKSAKMIFEQVETKGFSFDVEVILWAYKFGIPVLEEGVDITNDDERSTVNVFIDPIKMLWELIKIKFRVAFK